MHEDRVALAEDHAHTDENGHTDENAPDDENGSDDQNAPSDENAPTDENAPIDENARTDACPHNAVIGVSPKTLDEPRLYATNAGMHPQKRVMALRVSPRSNQSYPLPFCVRPSRRTRWS